MDMSQEELYTMTAAPMIKKFLEGYNVTIIAYGQTGWSFFLIVLNSFDIVEF